MFLKKQIKKQIVKSVFVGSCLLPIAAWSEVAPKDFAGCLSEINQNKNPEVAGMIPAQVATQSQKWLRALLAKLPLSAEKDILKLTGLSARDMQALKGTVAEGKAYMQDGDAAGVAHRLEVISQTYYELSNFDESLFVVITPEGKVLKTQLTNEKPIKNINTKFSLSDQLRTYYFIVKIDKQCKKNCDNYVHLADVMSLNPKEKPAVKIEQFPAKIATELNGQEAINISRSFFEEEVRYAVSRLVGVEKSRELPGTTYVLPDAFDTDTYDKASFTKVFKSCEKKLAASAKDKQLLVAASNLLN